jgi:hypothetical protein
MQMRILFKAALLKVIVGSFLLQVMVSQPPLVISAPGPICVLEYIASPPSAYTLEQNQNKAYSHGLMVTWIFTPIDDSIMRPKLDT